MILAGPGTSGAYRGATASIGDVSLDPAYLVERIKISLGSLSPLEYRESLGLAA